MRTQQQIEDLYAAREAAVSRLAASGQISSSDVANLCRHGQFQVASDHWALCDKGARSVLLHAHPHVASAARISDAQSIAHKIQCDECKDTGWAIRKEDDAPIACVMCDANTCR